MKPAPRGKQLSGWRILILSIIGISSILAMPVAQSAAQDATPVAAISFDPANCTTPPVSTDHMSVLMATPVAQPELPVTDGGIVALPAGVPSGEAELTAVTSTIEQLWACNN